jgi:hypothetical protein
MVGGAAQLYVMHISHKRYFAPLRNADYLTVEFRQSPDGLLEKAEDRGGAFKHGMDD